MDRSATGSLLLDRLMWEVACNVNDRSMIRYLLENGVQWYPEEDQSAKSCLYLAAERGDLAIVEDLVIKHGADVNKAGATCGRTPFHVAAMTGNVKLAKLLIKLGADVNKVDCEGQTTLYKASSRFNRILIVKLLIKSGADMDLPNTTGWTPMHIAAHGNNLQVVRLLIKSGAKKDMPNMAGLTPLHVAVQRGNEEIVAKLLEAGANRNTRLHDNGRGETPLATAVRLGHSRIVLLLTNEADTNCWMSSVCVEDFRKIVDIRAKDKRDRDLSDRSIAIEEGIESLFACILVGGTIVTAVILARGRQSGATTSRATTSTHVGRFLQMFRRK